VHRFEIYEEIKNSTMDASKSDAVDMDAIKKKMKMKMKEAGKKKDPSGDSEGSGSDNS
jgi:hypothetical protein